MGILSAAAMSPTIGMACLALIPSNCIEAAAFMTSVILNGMFDTFFITHDTMSIDLMVSPPKAMDILALSPSKLLDALTASFPM